MSREAIVFLLGFMLILIPFLGVPSAWKEQSIIGIGIVLMLCGYSLRRSAFLREIESEDGERVADSFSESIPTPKEPE